MSWHAASAAFGATLAENGLGVKRTRPNLSRKDRLVIVVQFAVVKDGSARATRPLLASNARRKMVVAIVLVAERARNQLVGAGFLAPATNLGIAALVLGVQAPVRLRAFDVLNAIRAKLMMLTNRIFGPTLAFR